jgi:hypothetical protein
MPELSEEERARRRYAVDFGRGSVELSGGRLTPEMLAVNERLVTGELSEDAFIDAVLAHARSLPAQEPRQEYFTTFEEAMKAGEQ